MNSISDSIENGAFLIDSWLYQLHDAEMFALMAGTEYDPDEMSVNDMLKVANRDINNIYDSLGLDAPDVRDDEYCDFEYSENPEILAENAMEYFNRYQGMFRNVGNDLSDAENVLTSVDPLDVSRMDLEKFANDVSDVLWGSPMASVWCARLSMEMGVEI